MPVIRKDQPLPQSAIIVLIYGPHGVAKTSLALTAKNPYHLDFDKGLKRAAGKADALVFDPKNPTNLWKEAKELADSGFFSEFDTIIVDTIKAAFDDFIMPQVKAEDFKAQKDPRKAFGLAGDDFILFANKIRNQGKDLYLLCHSKSVEDGEVTKNVCDITGNITPAYVLRCADQIGFLSMINGQRTITFNPTDANTGKNTAELPALILPHYNDPSWPTFAEVEISEKLRVKFASMDASQRAAMDFIAGWRLAIDAIDGQGDTTAADLLETMSGTDGIANIKEEHLKTQIRAYFMAHLKKIGYKWDKLVNEGKGGFVSVPAAPPATPPAETPPPVEQAPPPVVQAESNPGALVNNAPPVSPSIQFPEQAPAEEEERDPFENQSE